MFLGGGSHTAEEFHQTYVSLKLEAQECSNYLEIWPQLLKDNVGTELMAATGREQCSLGARCHHSFLFEKARKFPHGW